MKITCGIGPFFPVPAAAGGALEKLFLALCEEFARFGHEVTMISRRYADFPIVEEVGGVRHLRVSSFDRPSNMLLYRCLDVVYSWRVRSVLPASDITITNSVSMPLLIPRARAGKIYVDVNRYPKGHMGLYRGVDRLQACSTHIAAAVRTQSPSVAHLVKTIPNAVSRGFAERAAQPFLPERSRQVIYVGRLVREKGIDLLLKGFGLIASKHPGWKLVVIGPHLPSQGGDGEEFLAELKALAAGAGAQVEFLGGVFDEQALADHYSRSEIFVYPSVAEKGEAFPVAPLEAMACGCVPVVSDLRCFDDAVTPGDNGLAFDHRDETGKSLADALEQLITSDGRRAAIARRAKETSRRYAPEAVAKLFLEDFAELTGLAAFPRLRSRPVGRSP
jgi:glycosyltransferase involved in cell wall biosynthesis